MALPAVVVVFLVLVSGIQLASLQLRLQDAAADAARAMARGEGRAQVVALLDERIAEVDMREDPASGSLCVELTTAPSGVVATLPIRLTARSCAWSGGR